MLVYDCLSGVLITGQDVVESGSQAWVELGCSFTFISSEYSMLDIKWYFGPAEEPFLQWVPSSGREPQTVGRRFRSRVNTSHTLTNTTHGFKTEQVIRVARPTIYTSGEYNCKVATFTQEYISTHHLLVFGKRIPHFFSKYVFTFLYSRPWHRALPVIRGPLYGYLCVLQLSPGVPGARPLPDLAQ